jgi:hypothetical protein
VPNPLVIQKPELPASINPQGASVFDAPGQGILRKMVSWLGLDDPQQVMGVGAAMDVGPMGGGLIDAVAQRFPRFAAAIKAYHGSPHDFEAFDTSKIGTGEGAQAYGHGLYFAEQPEVAQQYRDALKWRGSNWDDPAVIAGRVLEEHKGDKAAAIAQLVEANQRNLGFKASEAGNVARQQAIDMLKAGDPLKGAANPGRMYEVGINAHPDQFLDWDKPLSQQHPDVQAALRKIDPARMDIIRNKSFDISASKFYDDLATKLHQPGQGHLDNAAATNALKEAGIPGIKYLDQGSRITAGVNKLGDNWFIKGSMTPYPTQAAAEKAAEAAGNVSRNFVVFDAKTIDILKKYGLLPPAVGATIAAQQSQQGEQ